MLTPLLLAMTWVGFQGSTSGSGVPDGLAAEVVRLAPAAWADYIARRETLAPLQVSCVSEAKSLDGTLVRRHGFEDKRLGSNRILMWFHEETKAGKLSIWRLHGLNSKYAFELRRTTLNGPYTVSEVKLLSDGLPSFAENVGLAPPRYSPHNKPGLFVPGLSPWGGFARGMHGEYHEIFTNPDYLLEIVSAVRDSESPHLVRVSGRVSSGKSKVESRFKATFDSSTYWLPISSEYADSNFRRTTTQTFGYAAQGLPLLSATHSVLEQTPGGSFQFPDGPMVSTETITYDPRPPRELDFTLSAFGLPEPYGVTWDRPTPWWLYIGGGTLAVLVIVILGYRWRRRAAEG